MEKIVLLLMTTVSLISAAGFSCSEARTPMEKLICSNEGLSRMDDTLADHYRVLFNASNELGRKSLKRVQLSWLKKRNSTGVSSPRDVVNMYRKQIDRMAHFRILHESGNEDVDITIDSAVQKLYAMMVDQDMFVSTKTTTRLNDSLFLIHVESASPIVLGIYAVNVQVGKTKRLIGGSPDIIYYPRSSTPIELVKTTGIRKGKVSSTISAIYPSDNSSTGAKIEKFSSFIYDGVSGGCGRGESIGITESKVLKSYSIEKKNRIYELVCTILYENCKNGDTSTVIERYPIPVVGGE